MNGGGPIGDPLRANLALMAPGTALRDGLERILRGRTGALIVLGYDKTVESICTGGFPLDVEFSATRIRELCKMDGAVVLSSDGSRIVRAAVHLMPDPKIPTEESGTRHRTAERVARQTGFPVISVSQSMRIISLYVNGQRHVLDDSAAILSRANQALATLERYKLRLDEVSGTLSALEIEDLVTVRDAVAVVQRLEMVRRIADEIAGYVVELGTDGRLIALQLDETFRIGDIGRYSHRVGVAIRDQELVEHARLRLHEYVAQQPPVSVGIPDVTEQDHLSAEQMIAGELLRFLAVVFRLAIRDLRRVDANQAHPAPIFQHEGVAVDDAFDRLDGVGFAVQLRIETEDLRDVVIAAWDRRPATCYQEQHDDQHDS